MIRTNKWTLYLLVLLSIGFFSFQSKLLADYKPEALQDSSGNPLYQFGTIDGGDFCYPYWMANYLKSSLGNSADLVRQSVVPSAMVDGRGDLFTMSLWGLDTSSGAQYMLQRFTASGNTISFNSTSIFPWTLVGVSINVTQTPSNLDNTNYVTWLKRYGFNAFHACIAQDVSDNGEVISMVWYIPATRHMNADNMEGIFYQVRSKANLATIKDKAIYYPARKSRNVLNQYAFHHLRSCNYDATRYAFDVETGNFAAASMSMNPQRPDVCLTQIYYCGLAENANDETGRIFNLGVDCLGSNYNSSGLRVYQRYIKWGDRCYGLCCLDGNRGVRTFSFFVGNGFSYGQKFTVEQLWHSAFGYIDHTSKSVLPHTAAAENYYGIKQ